MHKCETPYKLILLDSVDSTNNYAKELLANTLGGADLPFVVAAESQTAGRGRFGRSFVSPVGSGIYMSIVIPLSKCTVPLSLVTPAAAVATCRAIKKLCNASPQIKWVNDIYLNNKKICGILTETQTNSSSQKSVHDCSQYSETDSPSQTLIIGVGVNCFPGSFPDDVADIAGYISDDPLSFKKDQLLKEIVNNVLAIMTTDNNEIVHQKSFSREDAASSDSDFLSEYRDLCFILGKSITVTSLTSEEKYNATAVDIDRDGALIVKRINGVGEPETLRLISADVSVNFR